MQLNTIVVGFDGSECARAALDAAADLLADGGTVHVVTAYDEPSIRRINEVYATVPAEYRDNVDLLAGSRAHLNAARLHLEGRDVAHEDHFVPDDPASAIMDVAEKVDADLIVVGSRGLGMATRFLRGSVSAKVANHAKTSFLVITD